MDPVDRINYLEREIAALNAAIQFAEQELTTTQDFAWETPRILLMQGRDAASEELVGLRS